jgi:hypothetical protein
MRAPSLAVFAAVLLLAGCVNQTPEPTEPPTPSTTASSTPSATPTSEPSAAPTPVDPADYATQIADMFGPGVDFDSVDGNVHCGIWESREANPLDGLVTAAYAGCRPNEATYQTDPSSSSGGEVGCRGGQLVEGVPAQPVCNSGQAFVGEAPMNGPVGTLPVGSSITFAGFTCTSPDEASVECTRASDGAGFMIGASSYRYF